MAVNASIQQLFPESVVLKGQAVITEGLWVPGTPSVRTNGHPHFGGVVAGNGTVLPNNYSITLNGNVTVGCLHTRTDPVNLPLVTVPPSPRGSRTVTLKKPGQSFGDPATLRHLTLTLTPTQSPHGIYPNIHGTSQPSFA